jgi:hypothetical protein
MIEATQVAEPCQKGRALVGDEVRRESGCGGGSFWPRWVAKPLVRQTKRTMKEW